MSDMDASPNKVVGANVKQIREGWMSQAELGRKLAADLGRERVDPASITRLEKGTRPTTVDELAALARILGVNPAALMAARTDDAKTLAAIRSVEQAIADLDSKIVENVTTRRQLQAALKQLIESTNPDVLPIERRESLLWLAGSRPPTSTDTAS